MLDLIAATMAPDPGSDTARVCALESANYMRNQLLRDTDWASMAHSLEVRVPLVDFTLLGQVSSFLDRMAGGAGKQLLAGAPSRAVPQEIVDRPKTGFAVPVRNWLSGAARHIPDRRDSRVWSREVLERYDARAEQLLAA
ncbi:MAG: asparagine synthetase B, partial [Sphingomonadaceae bacterium]|nr:asparagine synthetase B [Sphingomonadaceae bacterium]